jgi:hypothetical protein
MEAVGHKLFDTGENQIEVTMRWAGDDWPLIGHPDGFIIPKDMDDKYLLELKSKGPYIYNRFKKYPTVLEAFPIEYAQVQCYMAATGMKSCIYIAKDRGSGMMHEEIIRFDPEWMDGFMADHFGPVVDAYGNGDSIETLSCHPDDYARRWCPLRNFCSGQDDVAATEAPPKIEESLLAYRQAKAMADDAKTMLDEAKSELSRFLIDSGKKKISLNGVTVQMVEGTRSSIDTQRLEEIVPEEVIKQVTKKTSYEYLKVSE